MSEISPAEAYRVMQEHCGIEIGDTVRVLRMPVDGEELGWAHSGYGCKRDRKLFVGKTRIVKTVGKRSIHLKDDIGQLPWPFFCLELVEKAKPELPPIMIGSNEVKFYGDHIRVGCETVLGETLRQIVGRLEK